MLTIDGSHLEGGGQIVRMAVSLAALTGKEMEITHIRAGRPRPGLAAQHVAAVRAVGVTCDATCRGLAVGSERLSFIPGELRKTDLSINVGTAGSVSLVIQAWLPIALRVGGSITVRGGTEVEHSPAIDYLEHVFLPCLRTAGAQITLIIRHRGYYPRGGGEVQVVVEPSLLKPIAISEYDPPNLGICSASSNLPDHVTERQAVAAKKRLHEELKIYAPVQLDRRNEVSTGSSCTTWFGAKGSTALGRRGLPAETVGETAADGLVEAIRAGGSVDGHLSDQLLIYLVQNGGNYTTSAVTTHTETMAWLLEQFGFEVAFHHNHEVEVRA